MNQDQDEYSKYFNADEPENEPEADAPEGEDADTASAVTLGGETSAEESPEKAPEVQGDQPTPAEATAETANPEMTPEDEQRAKSWEGRLKKREEELAAREAALAAKEPQKFAEGGEVEAEPVEVGLGDEEEDSKGDDIDSIKAEAMELAADPKRLAAFTKQMVADYGRDLVVFQAAISSPIIEAKAEQYVSSVNDDIASLVSELQDAFRSRDRQTVADAHEDLDELLESPEFNSWMDGMSAEEKAAADEVLTYGSPGKVIKLLQKYKDSLAEKDAPKEKTPEDIWAEDAATSVRSSAPLKLPTRAPASDDDEYSQAWNNA